MKKMKKPRISKKYVALMVAFVVALGSILPQVSAHAGAEETERESEWKQESTMPNAERFRESIFLYGKKIYVFGAIMKKEPTNNDVNKQVEIYDTETKVWSTGAEIPSVKIFSSYAKVGDKVYVMGGTNASSHYSKDTYVYDIKTDTWDTAEPMLMECSAACAAVIDEKIYVMGGYTSDGNSYVQIYDTKAKKWTKVDMPIIQTHATCQVYNGKIYVFGGSYSDNGSVSMNTVTIYDPVENTWSEGTPLPTEATHVTSILWENKVYVIGGKIMPGNKQLNLVQIYDIEKDAWSEGPSLTHEKSACASVLVKNKIYLFGGVRMGGSLTDTVDILDLAPVKIKLSILMYESEKQQLSISFNLAANKNYEWSSSDEKVVTVDENGIATAVGEGVAEVTVKETGSDYSETISIKVIGMRKLAAHILVGKTVRLYLTDDVSKITWKSSDETIATVDETGVVTGKGKGLVTITAEYEGEQYELYVRVSEK